MSTPLIEEIDETTIVPKHNYKDPPKINAETSSDKSTHHTPRKKKQKLNSSTDTGPITPMKIKQGKILTPPSLSPPPLLLSPPHLSHHYLSHRYLFHPHHQTDQEWCQISLSKNKTLK